MELARHWRVKDNRYLGVGRELVASEVDLGITNLLNGKELSLEEKNEHWARVFVMKMKEWGYTREVTEATSEVLATKMNGRAEKFLEEMVEELDRVYK